MNRFYARRTPVDRAILQGVTELEQDHPGLAEQSWRKAIAFDPGRPEPYHLLAELYVSSGRAAAAIPLLERLRQIAPRTPHTLCLLADAYARTGDDTKALTTAQQAVTVEPGCSRAHAVLGIELSNQLQHPRAIAELMTAHRLDPGSARITLTLAQAQLNAADLAAAAATLRSVISKNPGDARAWYLLGWCLARQAPTPENQREALEALHEACRLDHDNLAAAAELGRTLEAVGRMSEARVFLEKAWKGGVKSEEVGTNLTAVYRALGEPAAANTLAAELVKRSDAATRIKSLRTMLAAHPRDTDMAIQLALLESAQGNTMDAGGLITAVLRSGRHDHKATDAALSIYSAASSKADARQMLARILSETSGENGGSDASKDAGDPSNGSFAKSPSPDHGSGSSLSNASAVNHAGT